MFDGPATLNETPSAAAPDFARVLGTEGWMRLRPDIRRRFSEIPEAGHPIHYAGIMGVVDASWAGWLLAQACRIFGTPFAPYRGRNVPVMISLHSHEGDGAICWEREYRYGRRSAVKVRSLKRKAADGGLQEWVDGGFGMSLDLYEADGALHFVSRHYFWSWGRRKLSLPGFLSPGTVHVVHEDLGGGRFRFVMTVVHRLFGRLFYQDGEFAEVEVRHDAGPGDALIIL